MPATAASAPPTSAIGSDKELLDALGLSEVEAATALGRSRQSLYQAGLTQRQDYFKRSDLISLVFEAQVRSNSINLSDVYDYIGQTRPSDLDVIRTLSASDAQEPRLREYGELWIVIPDLAYLTQSHPEAKSMFVRLASESGVNVRFFVSNEPDRALLISDLNQAHRTTVAVEPWMGAIPYLIIGDPEGAADCYVFAGGRFLRHDWYGGPKLALLLRSLLQAGLIAKPAN